MRISYQVKEVSLKGPYIASFHFYEMPRIGKSTETKCRLVVTQDWELTDNEVSFGVIRCLKIECGNDCTTLCIYPKSLKCKL